MGTYIVSKETTVRKYGPSVWNTLLNAPVLVMSIVRHQLADDGGKKIKSGT